MSADTMSKEASNETSTTAFSLNQWFLSLPTEEQKAIREDKWQLAERAFAAGCAIGMAQNAKAKKFTRFVLTWIAAPRPPAHPKEMVGRQSFETFGKAVKFFENLAPDAKFVSIVEEVRFEIEGERSAEFLEVVGEDRKADNTPKD
jgi:hypothetical protein